MIVALVVSSKARGDKKGNQTGDNHKHGPPIVVVDASKKEEPDGNQAEKDNEKDGQDAKPLCHCFLCVPAAPAHTKKTPECDFVFFTELFWLRAQWSWASISI